MRVRRGDWDDFMLLPWERSAYDGRTAPNPETVSQADKVVLYDHKGRPLTKPRPRLGFRPEDAR